MTDLDRNKDAVPGGRDAGDTSLAVRLRRTFVLVAGLVGLAFVSTALSFFVNWAWLIPELDECRQVKAAASALNAAVLDEETGLRGYILTRDAQFLEPYRRGQLASAQAIEELDAHAAAVPAFALGLARTRVAAERWNDRWARPVAEMPVDGVPPSAQEGKALFDAYRGEQTAFATAIEQRTESLSSRERRAVAVRVGTELAICLVLLVLALRQHRALHDAIVAPVAALLSDIERVRDGYLGTTVHQSGPSELRQLGAGLNDMVRSLVVAKELAEFRDELVREHSDRLRQILDASREFSESLNLGYVVRSVRSTTMAIGRYDQVVVWLIDDDQKGLRDAITPESAVVAEDAADSALAWRAAKSGRITFEEPDGRVRFGDSGAVLVRARAIPLIVGARVVGVLEARHGEPQVASVEAVELLEMLAAHAATAIEAARLNQVAEERSQVDPLTRLHNRRRLAEDLEAECKRCARYGSPLAFVMLDVDHFKSFNDAHGHPQGDVALQGVAEVMGGAVRASDSAYRYGGEEFCVLLRETGAVEAMHLAERLRQRIELRFANGALPRITASFGVAEFSPDARTPRALIEAADAAMYEAKRGGRNAVVLGVPPSPSTPAPAAVEGPYPSGTIAVPRAAS